MDLAHELKQIYLSSTHHKTKLTEAEAVRYYQHVLDLGRLNWVTDGERIIGYVESWRLSFEKWGRLVCYAPFDIYSEDITQGSVAYLADIWIDPGFRKGWVLKELRYQFFTLNHEADYFCGEAFRKKTQPIKVFKRQEAYAKWAKEKVNE